MVTLIIATLSACQIGEPEDSSIEANTRSSIDPTLAMNGGSYFHDQVFPAHWSTWTTDGSAAIQSGSDFLVRGVRCKGRYCDDVGLLQSESGYQHTSSWWTGSFSEEQGPRICSSNGFVTGLSCSGRYCDNVNLRCSTLNNGGVRKNCYWTAPLSEESIAEFVAPQSMYVAGMDCTGRYCDNKALYVCQADDGEPTYDIDAMAAQYAPRLRFDQQFGNDSGAQSKCFPSDAGDYYQARAQGTDPVDLCNQDYNTIANNEVPIYYIGQQVGTNSVIIRYWFFYAWQSTCFLNQGSHAADWESMAVLIVNNELTRVAFYQHGGWYTKEPGSYSQTGNHPIGYVGKNSHGTYHDDGGSGGCLYFEDFRNPGGNNYHMDTWNNLVKLERGGSAPAWMNCTGSGCFDGVGHPIEQTGSLPAMGGCGKDGCDKSSLGSRVSFLTDPSGSHYSPIMALHSGRVLDVQGNGTGDGANIYQYDDWGNDNQRFLFESMGGGYFRIKARHSGRCIDVSGGSSSNGANIHQWGCGSQDNQRFQLEAAGSDTFRLKAKHSGKCVDIAGVATGNGANAHQWSCHSGDNQRWSFSL